ncbi:hypothetical protein [Bdellovibrio sp. NC01]|uniref:hypothetical protein n=1 Tax=Bdellovibrio sp. NC01 TaxID=2220073 RepID=UPI00115ACC8D|nr:hypothetical protein [Bdellovibrio sp. NC01]QDK37921.1 hypothetical protein DOE51_10160 [Bdellovibrio sp. NC01]
MFIARQNLYRWIALYLTAKTLIVFIWFGTPLWVLYTVPLCCYFAAEVLSTKRIQSVVNFAVLILAIPASLLCVYAVMWALGIQSSGWENIFHQIKPKLSDLTTVSLTIVMISAIPVSCVFILAQLTKRFLLPKVFKSKTIQ